MDIASGITFSPSFSPSLGVSYTCTTPTSSTYACNITIDNQSGQCISPTVDITMNGTYSGYSAVEWRDSCGSSSKIISSDVSRSPPDPPLLNTPLYLTYSSGGAGGWFKLKDASFNSRQSGRQDFIPNNVKAYDTTDDTDVNHKVLSGNSGLLVQYGALQPGANAYVGGVLTYSTNNWFTDGYLQANDVSYSKYIDYVKARKDFKTITNLSEITTDGVYSISLPVTLSATQFDGKKVVLVVQGTSATFTSDFIPAGGSVAVLAKDIIIDPSVTEIDAILIGQTVTTGVSVNGLKIKGNLIDESALSVERTQSDGRMPSLFVVSNIQMYLDLLPYLSTSTYDWRQIQ